MSQRIFDGAQFAFFRNAFFGFGLTVLTSVLNIIGFAVLVRLLDLETYGFVLLASYIINQAQLFDGGVLQSLEKYIPHYAADGKYEEVAAVITLGFVILTVIALIVSGGIVLSLHTDLILQIPHQDSIQLKQAGWAVAILVLATWPIQILRHVAFGLLNHHHVYMITFLVTLGGLVLMIIGSVFGASSTELIILRALPLIPAVIPLVFSIRQKYSGRLLSIDLPLIRQVGRDVSRFTTWLLVMKGALLFKFLAERAFPTMILGVNGVPLFHALLAIVGFVIGLNNGFKQVALPLAAGLTRLERSNELSTIALDGTAVMTAMFAPLLITLSLFSDSLLTIVGGSQFAALSEGLMLQLLLLSVLVPRAFAHNLLLGEGSALPRQAAWAVSSNLLYACLCPLFLSLWGAEWGIVSNALSQLIFMPWLLILLVRSNKFDVPALVATAGRALIPSWVIGTVVFFILQYWKPSSMSVEAILLGAVTFAGLALASFSWGLPSGLRTQFLRKMRHYVPDIATRR